MAFDVTQTPVGTFLMSDSPIIFVAGDPVITDPKYRVVCRVKVWSGNFSPIPAEPTVILDKAQGPDGNAVFNVGPIAEDLFEPPQPTYTFSTGFEGGDLALNMQVQLGYDANDGSGYQAVFNSVVMVVTQGYSVFPHDINDFQNRVAILASQKILSIRPEVEQWIVGQPAFVWAFWRGSSLAVGDKIRFEYTTTGGSPGTFENNFDAISSDDPPVNNSQSILGAEYGPVRLNLAGVDYKKRCSYMLRSDGGVDYDRRFVFFKYPICDIGADTIVFINRYGVWDFMHFYAVQRKGLDVSRSSFKRRIASQTAGELGFDDWTPQDSVYRVQANRTYEVTTGWITGSYNPLMEDLVASKRWYSSNLSSALVLQDTSFKEKLDSDEELISYTFKFKVANPHIQDVQ